jgi:hypothetical protein
MNQALSLGIVACLAAAGLGCSGQPATAERGGAATEEQGVVHTTVVRLDPDPSKIVVTYEDLTQDRYQAAVAARLARAAGKVPAGTDSSGSTPAHTTGGEDVGTATQAISTDSCTDVNALWIYDNTSNTNGHPTDGDTGSESCGALCYTYDMICFLGQGGTYLTNYTQGCDLFGCWTWYAHSLAYWPGVAGGYFEETGIPAYETFSANGPWAKTNAVGQDADFVYLNN